MDVTPPGAAAIIITPIAISGDSGQIETINKDSRKEHGPLAMWKLMSEFA